jgi:uncharacterized protein
LPDVPWRPQAFPRPAKGAGSDLAYIPWSHVGERDSLSGVALNFRWDPRKASTNLAKHGVSFEEAATAFGDPLSLTIPDPDHSDEEQRFILLGRSRQGRLLIVAHAEIGDTIRIVSARRAMRRERLAYEES